MNRSRASLLLKLILLASTCAAQTKPVQSKSATREAYAATLESTLLARGLDAYVTTQGKTGTTLKISLPVMGRPIVYEALHSKWLVQAVSAGFKYLILTDSDDDTWGFQFDTTTATWKAWEPDTSYEATKDSGHWDGMNQR